MLWLVQQRARGAGAPVRVVVGGEGHPGLPEPAAFFPSHSYHHLPQVVEYMARARTQLKPHGQVAIVEYRRGSLLTRIIGHASDPAAVKRDMGQAGYRLLAEHDLVKGQLFLVFGLAAQGDGT